jgi:nicotinamidase-related amidase
MDMQVNIVARFGDDEFLLARMERAIQTARSAGVPVIYVRVAFRDGHPEVAATNRTFAVVAAEGGYNESSPETAVHPRIAPQPRDVVIVKKRVSAFTGSGLDVVLRGLGVDTLVLSGISTSGVVLSTLRQAADLDFRLIVLSDGCADADPEVHRVLLDKVFPRQAEVVTIEEWVRSLRDAADYHRG